MAYKFISNYTKQNKSRSERGIIFLFLFFLALSCTNQDESSIQNSKVVLNHIILTVDQPTYSSIIKSEFLKDTFSAINNLSPQSGGNDSWSRSYIYGQNTYIELFGSRDSNNDGFSGVGFGVDEVGDLDTLFNSIPDSLSNKYVKQTMNRNSANEKIPWFYFITSSEPYTNYKLRIFVMEYDLDFMKRRFSDIDPELINITRKLYNHKLHNNELLFKDIIEIDLALNDFDTRKLAEELQIFNYTIEQKENVITGTGADIKVNIKAQTENTVGICRIKFSLTEKPYEPQTIQFSDKSKLILNDNLTAEWYFDI